MTSRKSRRIRTCASVVVAAVLAVSAAACSSAAPGAVKNSTLTVVTLNPFTGQDGPFGPEQAAGCQAAAKSTSPAVWNASIPAVTTASPVAVQVHTYAAGVAALKAGKKIDYVGAAGSIDFNKWHNSNGGFEIAAYQSSGNLTQVSLITAGQLALLTK